MFLTILDYLGTLAFAISGLRLANIKRFDLFGAYVIGLVTACGGGTIRDLLLGVTPFWMTQPSYLVITALALVLIILFRPYLNRMSGTLFIFDTIGLAFFVVVGLEKTLTMGYPLWVAIIMGTLTGAFGGILRDTLINEVPLIFRKEIYALACVIGGLAYGATLKFETSAPFAEVVGASVVIITRILAQKYNICLPTLLGDVSETPPRQFRRKKTNK